MLEINNDRAARTIYLRMSGTVTLDETRAGAEAARRATDDYRGEPHMVLADMRGVRPLAPEAAQVMGDAIAYQRARGVVCCVHLSDSSIVRLQAARLAREAVSGTTDTFEVVSLEEAEHVLSETRAKMLLRR